MLSGDQCNGVSELAEGHTYIRGRCKQLGNLYSPNRDDGRCFITSDLDFLVHKDDFGSPVDTIDQQTENICGRRVSMTPTDVNNDATPCNETAKIFPATVDRRLSRDIGIQAFSLEIEEEEKEKLIKSVDDNSNEVKPPRDFRKKSFQCDQVHIQRDHRPSIFLRRDSCHFHKLISPQNEVFVAHCTGANPILECTDSFDTFKSHDGTSFVEVQADDCQKHHCCHDHYQSSIDSTITEHGHRYSTCSSDSSIITKYAADSYNETARRSSKWKSGLVYFMDPCIEDSTENCQVEGEYNESEQSKPLLEKRPSIRETDHATTKFERRTSFKQSAKSIDETTNRRAEASAAVPNVEGIELASDAVCPFGLAKNLEKQICIIPSRKKKSSGRPSFLKLVTLILIGSALLITISAIKEAYY